MKREIARIMIAGTKSGSGKTTITCGILQMLMNRKMEVASLKCGPDYIDPRFHEKVVGVPSGNLDGFLMEPDMIRSLLLKHGSKKEITVLEGVMGYYDGIGSTTSGSTHQVAMETKTPVILVVDCKGMGVNSIAATIYGFVNMIENNIVGVIFNQMYEKMYEDAAALVTEMGLIPCGYVPYMKEMELKSRHLGLVTVDEVVGIKEKIEKLADTLETSVEIEKIIELANKSEVVEAEEIEGMLSNQSREKVRIAVARDEAFCFIYPDNLWVLEQLGCELVEFSPIRDEALPEHVDGLLLYGGYPELYAKELWKNESMRQSIGEALQNKLPTIAECGGFMYLQQGIEDGEGMYYPMVGALPGKAFATKRLMRFGYVEIEAKEDTLLCKSGEKLPAHEFHYWDSEQNGTSFVGVQPRNGVTYECVHGTDWLHAGYPHIHFASNMEAAKKFVKRCRLR